MSNKDLVLKQQQQQVETKNFLGLPIEGTVYEGYQQAEQRPVEELTPLLQKVLNHDELIALRWKQYTPYFNDGDACIFGVGEIEARISSVPETAGWDEDGYIGAMYFVLLEKYPGKYEDYDVSDELKQDLTALAQAVGFGGFDNVLLKLFGDHATITIRPGEKIQIEFYDHE